MTEGMTRTWVSSGDLRLPVVDVTDPAFAMEVDAEQLPELAQSSLERMEKLARMPAPLRTMMRRSLARNSVLLGGRSRAGAVMSGMTTYLNKLGPANLDPAWAGRYDDNVARMIPCVAVRLRLRAIADLLAVQLTTALPTAGRTVRLLNLGGGTAMDSLNALILVQTSDPSLLAGRQIVVHVLDTDDAGPRFGAECAQALTADGAPLAGLELSVEPTRYDWSNAAQLEPVVGDWADELIAGSSEGALFEYGSDAEITANLDALRRLLGPGFTVIGSLWRESPLTRAMQRSNPLGLQLRTLSGFGSLAQSSGWTLVTAQEDNPVYSIVTLRS